MIRILIIVVLLGLLLVRTVDTAGAVRAAKALPEVTSHGWTSLSRAYKGGHR